MLPLKKFALLSCVLTLGLSLSLVTMDAEAKRLGGGRSLGMQRQAMPPPAPSAAARPDAAAATRTPSAAPATAPATGRSWMGPLAGLAAGLGLAALASHFGLGEAFANILLIGLLVIAGVVLFKWFMGRRIGTGTMPTPAMAGSGTSSSSSAQPRMYRSGLTEPIASPSHTQRVRDDVPVAQAFGHVGTAASTSAPSPATPSVQPHVPANFDVAGFVRQAQVNFIRLQAAHDAANLDDIREFTTPQMFAEIQMDLRERGNAAQKTDVLSLDASVLEAVEEDNRYVVSVRFTGQIREDEHTPVQDIDEIWNLTKPTTGKSGWLLAGIQQAR
jgi:predicted lipid-binding transport protein (Tim44 family)